jgi:urea carboxylase
MFRKVLIANRGEIAGRILRTLRRMGIASVAVYSEADRFSPPVLAADEAIGIGPAAAAESYLLIKAILEACRKTGAEAVHPGYGFLSERPEFAEALELAGIRFVGPRPEQMRAFGLKHVARDHACRNGVPLLPGSGVLETLAEAEAAAARIGYPVMLKSTAGGGGIGMQLCPTSESLGTAFVSVQRLSGNNFGDGRVFLEKFVSAARHIEVQIFGDGRGGVVTLGERDCSLQRRNQKVIEETPAPGISDTTRDALHSAAAALGRAVNYESAGTVEFIYDALSKEFYFLEVNTRLQVEHCVTEQVFGIDLVEWMLRQAAGGFVLPAQTTLVPSGAAIQSRLYAENATENFRPSTGRLTEVRFAPEVRVDSWIETGTEVTRYYDPLLAKLIATAPTRAEAMDKLQSALRGSSVAGIETNIDYLSGILDDPAVRAGEMTTGTLAALAYHPASIDVLSAGTQSSVQDWPGRLGYWDLGVPPSGPMDDRSFRLVNRIVGNAEGAAGLELTLTGPTLRFNAAAIVALGGAAMAATLDGVPMAMWTTTAIAGGQVLTLGGIEGPGSRSYLAIRNGIAAPLYLGARATFALGGFGGHATGVLRTGDVLRFGTEGAITPPLDTPPPEDLPVLTRDWDIGVLYGPHGAPDFFRQSDIDVLFSATYEVHYNSARTGVRLTGPKPLWTRADGGEAGLHPSNIHDNAYAIGALDFTGDMPIILGPDGPSLGGFVCPAVVTKDELWKTGQLRPGDRVRFRRVARSGALMTPGLPPPRDGAGETPILLRREGEVPVTYRIAGDSYLLIEFGPPVLDIRLRLRVQLLLEALRGERLPGLIDLTPGIRSLQVHYDPGAISLARLMDRLAVIEAALPDDRNAVLPSRTLHLPLSWNDEQAQLAMRRYQELVRPDAPWCPSNIEFIRRINGLHSIEDVRRVVFEATYLVLGLGDVYLGAPVATPLDPRHRLVTTKYNPARPWTPENAVGIGGAYLCIYGMEGPGGYQLFGRTLQVWNSWRRTAAFQSHALLRHFDQIRFFPVSGEELLDARASFPFGQYPLRIEETRFSMAAYTAELDAAAAEIATAKALQQAAFNAERRRWAEQGLDRFVEADEGVDPFAASELPEGCAMVESPVPGNVWRVLVAEGDCVRAGETIVVLESMKMEMRVVSQVAGRVVELLCRPGREVRGGQGIAVIRKATP